MTDVLFTVTEELLSQDVAQLELLNQTAFDKQEAQRYAAEEYNAVLLIPQGS